MDEIKITHSDLLGDRFKVPQNHDAQELSGRTWSEWASEHRGVLIAGGLLATAALGIGAYRMLGGRLAEGVLKEASGQAESLGTRVLPKLGLAEFDKDSALLAMQQVQKTRVAVEAGQSVTTGARMWQPYSAAGVNPAKDAMAVKAEEMLAKLRTIRPSPPPAFQPHIPADGIIRPENMVEDLIMDGRVVDPRPVVMGFHHEGASAVEQLAQGFHGGVALRPGVVMEELYGPAHIPHGMRPLMNEIVADTEAASASNTFSAHMPGIANSEMPATSLFRPRRPL
ncbi:MAG: hypothetical protein K2X81_00150 [Candidatus Obscuribacterales bacterium]|nr:hypothetical protein [Candidatus Obscuribacterales bacterium]